MRREVAGIDEAFKNGIQADAGSAVIWAEFDQLDVRLLTALCGSTLLMNAIDEGFEVDKALAALAYGVDYTDSSALTDKQLQVGKKLVELALVGSPGSVLGKYLKKYVEGGEELANNCSEFLTRLSRSTDNAGNKLRKRGRVQTFLERNIYVQLPSNLQPGYRPAKKIGIEFVPRESRQTGLQEMKRLASKLIRYGTKADIMKQAICRIMERCRVQKITSSFLFQVNTSLILLVPPIFASIGSACLCTLHFLSSLRRYFFLVSRQMCMYLPVPARVLSGCYHECVNLNGLVLVSYVSIL